MFFPTDHFARDLGTAVQHYRHCTVSPHDMGIGYDPSSRFNNEARTSPTVRGKYLHNTRRNFRYDLA